MPRPRWRLIRSGALRAPINMALDEALLESVAAGRSCSVLRLYRWDPPAVSIGYFQQGGGVLNLAACCRLGLDVVRRVTGGRAVLHDREVTYAVISPEGSNLFPGGILDTYLAIAQVLQHALAGLGLETELSKGRNMAGAGGSACFTAPGSFELLCCGCKIAGSAQKRQGGAFLQHGSIPIDLDPERLFLALNTRGGVSAEAGALALTEKVGWVNRFLSRPVHVEDLEDLLLAGFAELLGVELSEEVPSDAEWERARQLQAERYGNPAWTLERLTGPSADRGKGLLTPMSG
ncbi:MAG: octanoyltransferase [Desulfuromonas sp.]|uniref:lipoate--protein ligase family protein n=1 Tax=Desulfuromonas sp. TaxID=892 RepID=UPI000CB34B24|nr:biotin/lipoate A/B protein ligase family protein [Desulfuromonas sp.]PLX85748.1 MAG: octanoyltransferase [Desulfuromonas sp.]